MLLAFLDEFGNAGYGNRGHESYHPAFGYAGILVRASKFDELSQAFLVQKATAVAAQSGKAFGKGLFDLRKLGRKKILDLLVEKKSKIVLQNRDLERGCDSFAKSHAHRITNRLLNVIDSVGGEIFLIGYEKDYFVQRGVAPALSLHLMEEVIDALVNEARRLNEEVVIFFDDHQLDKEGVRYRLVSEVVRRKKYYKHIRKPPAFCDSMWSQGIQIADWVCFLLGKVMGGYCYNHHPAHKHYQRVYGDRFRWLMSGHSIFYCRGTRQVTRLNRQLRLPGIDPEMS